MVKYPRKFETFVRKAKMKKPLAKPVAEKKPEKKPAVKKEATPMTKEKASHGKAAYKLLTDDLRIGDTVHNSGETLELDANEVAGLKELGYNLEPLAAEKPEPEAPPAA